MADDLLNQSILDNGDNKEEDFSASAPTLLQVEQIQQYFLKLTGSVVGIRQLPSEGLSFQLWPAALALVSLMDQQPELFTKGRRDRPIKGLELGSGTGLVGIAAATILGAHITLTDLPHVLPNLLFNVAGNKETVTASARGGTLSVDCIRWGNESDCSKYISDGNNDGKNSLDLILASDVVYYQELFDPLLKTLEILMPASGTNTEFVMAHLRRWKKDSVFFNKAKKVFNVNLIPNTLLSRDQEQVLLFTPLPGKGKSICKMSRTQKVSNCKWNEKFLDCYWMSSVQYHVYTVCVNDKSVKV